MAIAQPGRPESGSLPSNAWLAIQRMEHVGIVVDDLAAATEFFVEFGLVLQGEGTVEGRWVDRGVGLEGVRADIASCKLRTATDDSS